MKLYHGLTTLIHGVGFEPTTSTTSRWHSPAELAVHFITIMHDLGKLSSGMTKKHIQCLRSQIESLMA